MVSYKLVFGLQSTEGFRVLGFIGKGFTLLLKLAYWGIQTLCRCQAFAYPFFPAAGAEQQHGTQEQACVAGVKGLNSLGSTIQVYTFTVECLHSKTLVES